MPTDPPRVSVVVPCLNAASTLPDALAALERQQWDAAWEIVVADNGSTDASCEVIRRAAERSPRVRLVDASDRSGQAHAMNVGARAARGDLLIFCDADDEVGEGWLRAMATSLDRHDVVAAAWDIERLNPPRLRRSRANPQREGLQRWKHPPHLMHAGGGSLGVRRAVHERVGGFDETLVGVHDTDYCWRLQLTGVRLQFVPEAVVHIRFRADLLGLFRQARAYGRGDVALYARYRASGMASLSWVEAARSWCRLVVRCPHLLDAGRRGRWLWKLGIRIGRLEGSLAHRVVAF